MTTLREVALLRLAAQRLVGEPEPGPVAAVRRLLAAQGQDLPGVLTSVALRTRSRSRQEVTVALDGGELVRSWPVRGTLHLVAADDLPWLRELAAGRAVGGSRARRAALGLDNGQLERAREIAEGALAGGAPLSREELFAAWDAGGVPPDGQRGVHLLRHLAMTGTLVLGPLRGAAQLVVPADGWLPRTPPRDRDEALGELAGRFFAGHGPATVQDLARWSGLTLTDCRRGAALARPGLASLDVDGTEHLLDPETPGRLAAARRQAEGVLLLPGFDELVLGYGDRRAVLDPEREQDVCPGGNGMFRPTVVVAGHVVGTWRRGTRRADPPVVAEPFAPLDPDVAEAVQRCAAALP